MRRLLPILTVLVLATTASGQVLLPATPTWTSQETDLYGTGLDIGDVNGDGWLDLAVSNGNDILAAPNLVYLNAAGDLPTAASWVSSDQRFSGHCQLADVDGDGLPELMVANYITGGWGPAQVQLYANVGGALSTTPTWESPATFHSFRASFGDPDQDGDLDLAVATGEAYHNDLEPNLVFFNVDGVLQATPGWVSQVSDASYDAKFVDIDGDGDQDLAFLGGGSGGMASIYFNEGGVLATTPGWTTGGTDNGNTFDFDDLDADGRPDLLVGNNDQLGGSGPLRRLPHRGRCVADRADLDQRVFRLRFGRGLRRPRPRQPARSGGRWLVGTRARVPQPRRQLQRRARLADRSRLGLGGGEPSAGRPRRRAGLRPRPPGVPGRLAHRTAQPTPAEHRRGDGRRGGAGSRRVLL